jgi:hypothetical protein
LLDSTLQAGYDRAIGTKKQGHSFKREPIVYKSPPQPGPGWRSRRAPRIGPHRPGVLPAWLTLILVLAGAVPPAFGYTPESPEVRAMLDKALSYLDNSDPYTRFGGKSLIALALVKGDRPADHPKIQEAVESCRRVAQTLESQHTHDAIYDLAISIIFLCELDAEQYQSEINTLMQLLLKWQREYGPWGYLGGTNLGTGDTSMTQYGTLALWTADRTGAYRVDPDAAVRVVHWLFRTQDPSGGWGYQGIDPGSFQRVEQLGVQQSLSAAGLGSVYVLADLLRLTGDMKVRNANDGLPPALKMVRKQGQRPSQGPLTDKIDRAQLRSVMADGEQWFARNFVIEPDEWVYYYLYALERYKSFQELATGKFEQEPDWYNQGVEYLQSKQAQNGSWTRDAGPDIDTCFAILFLVRGTQKSIEKAEAFDGRLRGGRGLPTKMANVTVGQDGQLVRTPFQGKAETLLTILEASAGDDIETLGGDFVVTLSDDPRQRQRELERLRRLVSDEDFVVRLAALRALHNTRDLDNVPVFIFALGDPDARVVRQARDSLRLLSRKINGFGLSDEPTQGAKLEAIEHWKQWYLSIRPDAQFLN